MILDIDRKNTLNGGHSYLMGIDQRVADVSNVMFDLSRQQVDAFVETYPIVLGPESMMDKIRESMYFWAHYSGLQQASAKTSKKTQDFLPTTAIEEWYDEGVKINLDKKLRELSEIIKMAKKDVLGEDESFDSEFDQSQEDDEFNYEMSEDQKFNKVLSIVTPKVPWLVEYVRQKSFSGIQEEDEKKLTLLNELAITMTHMATVLLLKSRYYDLDRSQMIDLYERLVTKSIDEFTQHPPRNNADRLTGYMAKKIMQLTEDSQIRSLMPDQQLEALSMMQHKDPNLRRNI